MSKRQTFTSKRYRERAILKVPSLDLEREFVADWVKDYGDYLRFGAGKARQRALDQVKSLSKALGRDLEFTVNIFADVEVETHVIITSTSTKPAAFVAGGTKKRKYADDWTVGDE